MHIKWMALSLSTATIFAGCGECSDCDRGPIPVGYVRVQTATSVGPLGGVGVRLELPTAFPLVASTNALGEHVFEVLEIVDGEEATLIVVPPSAYATPPPRLLSLVLGDTLDVQVLLESAP
jgi:hypothetical protein